MTLGVDEFNGSLTSQFFAKIVQEQDEYTMNLIKDYVKEKQSKGELINVRIIEEGKLRHIINLGLSVYNGDIKANDLFPQEQYIEFLRHEMLMYQQENIKLKNQIEIMERMSGLRSVDTDIK